MKVEFKDREYVATVWNESMGRVASAISYDTETTVSDDAAVVPDYVLGTAFNGSTVYFIRRQDLSAFWGIHRHCIASMHTAAFDVEVTTQACNFDFHHMIEAGLIRDVSIYYRLLGCATKGDVPHKYNLALMARELLGIELQKDDTLRMEFGRFYKDAVVDYPSIPADYLVYAGRDAIATYQLAERLEPECRAVHAQHTPLQEVGTAGTAGMSAQWGWLGHDIQLRGDIALRQIERNGLHVDEAAVKALDVKLTADARRRNAALAEFGYIPGAAGNQNAYNRVIGEIERERGVRIATTPKSGKKSQAAADLASIADHPFVDEFLRAKEGEKLRKTYVEKLGRSGGIVHPRYTLLVRTGRTSCSSPNIQNLPRDGGVRECVVPAPGHVLVTCDYSMLELCTLAQCLYGRYGHSAMRDLINAGVDLHRRVAAQILGKPEAEVSRSERQKAKAVSFGLPGGMGASGLRQYAKTSFGVELSAEEGEQWRAAWLRMFPEMVEYLARCDDLQRLGETLNAASHPNASPSFSAETAAAIVMRVAGGASGTTAGRSFGPAELNWAWAQIADSRAGSLNTLAADIVARRGSRELQSALIPRTAAVVPTGRVRSNCSFTESRNGPFQGLAADGAKLALYDLVRAGHRVVAFVHDEVLVEVPEADDYRGPAESVAGIMIDAMRRICPDVRILTEYAVMRRWRKDAKAVYDEQGRLIPFEDALVRNAERRS
jgi:hypothetical protein